MRKDEKRDGRTGLKTALNLLKVLKCVKPSLILGKMETQLKPRRDHPGRKQEKQRCFPG